MGAEPDSANSRTVKHSATVSQNCVNRLREFLKRGAVFRRTGYLLSSRLSRSLALGGKVSSKNLAETSGSALIM